MKPSKDIATLVEIMRRLRDPVGGCPWDLEQDFSTIAPYSIEEAYEVADAIERGDMDDLRLELGDLLLQSVYHAQMASEAGYFDFGDVVEGICAKMIRRHPHVFGTADTSAEEFSAAGLEDGTWERIKAEEKAENAARRSAMGLPPKPQNGSLLDDVPTNMPSPTVAMKLQKAAAKVGFDWPDSRLVLDKVAEELSEFEQALDSKDKKAAEEEFGDLLFSLINVARHCKIDPEKALRITNTKFRKRFGHIEQSLKADDIKIEEADLDQMEKYWIEAKNL